MKNYLKSLFFAAFWLLTATYGMAQWTSNPSSVYLDPTNTNKNVGIGTGTAVVQQKLQVKGGNVLLDYTNVGATTGNLFFGGVTYPVNANPALSNGMRLSYNNANAKGGYMDVRTTAATDGLIFRVDAGSAAGTERMRINANGNIGMAAPTPLSALSIGGNGNALWKTYIKNTNTSQGSAGLYVESNTPTAAANKTYSIVGTVPAGTGWTYGLYGASTKTTAGAAGRSHGVYGVAGNATSGYNYGVVGEISGTNNGAGIVGYDPSFSWGGNTNGKWAGYFIGNMGVTGSVGIGTNTPLHKLHVTGAAMISGPSPGGGPMLLFSDDVSSTAYPNGRWGIEYHPTKHGLNFWQPWNPSTGGGANWLLFLKDDGKIGMGVDPNDCSAALPAFPNGYRLYVKDGILTEKVVVANYCSSSWADYVFAPDYKLKPLSEVAAFVEANKHLPNVPSALDIEKNGLDVAEMLSRQMEKIEELTLYMIQLDRDNKALQAELSTLKADKH